MGIVVVVHCSRDSLFCREEILNGSKKPGRKFSTVIHAAMQAFDGKVSPDEVQGHISCGIAGRNFNHNPAHPEHGAYNSALCHFIVNRYGEHCFSGDPDCYLISLDEVIREQLKLCGVTNVTQDDLDTFSNMHLHSHKLGDTGRNGVLVMNHMNSHRK